MARPDLGADGTLRPVVDLLVEQIECALKIEVTLNPYLRLMLGRKDFWHGVCSVLDEQTDIPTPCLFPSISETCVLHEAM